MNWGRGFAVGCLLLLGSCLGAPWVTVWAQLPEQAQELSPSPAVVRVAVADIVVQGSYGPEEVRAACTAILPNLAACLQTVLDLQGRLPAKITLRFNLGSNGKVVWTKLIEPTGKKLEECLSRSLATLRLPPAGTSLTRVTLVLECRSDHLLSP